MVVPNRDARDVCECLIQEIVVIGTPVKTYTRITINREAKIEDMHKNN